MEQALHPAIAALDFAKAGAILANMIESYLAAGAPPFDHRFASTRRARSGNTI